MSLVGVIETALSIYSFAILLRIILSWVPLRSGTLSYRLFSILYDVTEPYLRLFRRYLPLIRFGNAALDLSPIVGLAVLFIVQEIIRAFV
ncbi:MAG TPA: YggT family protein [Thermoleophilia bacterium]|nr:YggT family protein [Thermoleophilia bacterium]